MARVNLPFVETFQVNGRRYAYYRRGAARLRLPDPAAAGFIDAYRAAHAAAEEQRPPAGPTRAASAPGSLAALIAAYKNSEEWRGLAPASRKDYDKALEPLREKYGHHAVATMPRRFVFDLRDKYARKTVETTDPATGAVTRTETATPRRANRMVNVLRLLMTWAVDREWRRDNPALRVGRLKTGPGYERWSDAAFDAFMAHPKVPGPLKRAAALGIYTGQRKADCLAMTWSMRAGGAIEVVQAKTGARLWIPEHPALTRILDAAPRGDALQILTRADGQPWGEDHFNHAFAAAVKTAGLSGLSFHGLRKAASARLAETGATDAEIDAVLGHADPKMTRLYRKQADQKIRASAAIEKLVARKPGTSRKP